MRSVSSQCVAFSLALSAAVVPVAGGQTETDAHWWFENAPRAQVLLLGMFHFADAGLDSYKPQFDIDVRSPERQHEIEDLVERLAAFRPTRIVVEVRVQRQTWLDSLYQAYLAGGHELRATEVDQLGLRLARRLGHDRVWAVDAPSRRYNPDMTQEEWEAEVERRPPVDYTWGSRYVALYRHEDSLKTTMPLRDFLILLNESDRLTRSLGHYLVGEFTRSSGPDDYFGADEMTFWWNRNLRIFRNLQRITASPEERIILIIGAGHVPILRHFVEASPEYEIVEVADVLR